MAQLGTRGRRIMRETCDFMTEHVKNHRNLHGPGQRMGGATANGGYIVPTHDAESHQRELEFWAARKALYGDPS